MTKTMNQAERAKKMYKIIAKAWADEAFKRDVKSLDRQKHPLCTPIHQKQCLIKEGPGSLEGSAGIQKDRAMGQGSGVISLHGRFRAHGHTIRTALPACGIRLGLINRG